MELESHLISVDSGDGFREAEDGVVSTPLFNYVSDEMLLTVVRGQYCDVLTLVSC